MSVKRSLKKKSPAAGSKKKAPFAAVPESSESSSAGQGRAETYQAGKQSAYGQDKCICRNAKCKLRRQGCKGFEGCPGFQGG